MKRITIKNLINKALDMDSKIHYWESPNVDGIGTYTVNDQSYSFDRADQRIAEYTKTKEQCVAKLKRIGFDYDKLAAMIDEVADD